MTILSKPSLFEEARSPLSDEDVSAFKLKSYLRHHERTSSIETASISAQSECSDIEGVTEDTLTTVDLFPYSMSVEDLRKQGYRTVKRIYWIRHAQGYHNVGDAKSRDNIDARLTPTGIEQCRSLAKSIREAPKGSMLHDVLTKTELVVTSPVTRCVQTSLYSLQPLVENKPDVPFVANDCIRETVNFNCDRRRPIHEIAHDFPQVDFSQACPVDEDDIWERYVQLLGDDTEYTQDRESAEIHTIADRCRGFFVDWLANRPEEHIVVCCHATVSRCIFNFGMDQGKSPTDVPQVLDRRCMDDRKDEPVVNFGHDAKLEQYLRDDFKNCELRSMIVAYK